MMFRLRGKAFFNTGGAVRYGFAYATTAIEMVISPTLVNSDNIDGSDNYSAVIEGLAAHTRYYYRSFLYRDGLYYYGDRMYFDTE